MRDLQKQAVAPAAEPYDGLGAAAQANFVNAAAVGTLIPQNFRVNGLVTFPILSTTGANQLTL
jgi:hypothetical protein